MSSSASIAAIGTDDHRAQAQGSDYRYACRSHKHTVATFTSQVSRARVHTSLFGYRWRLAHSATGQPLSARSQANGPEGGKWRTNELARLLALANGFPVWLRWEFRPGGCPEPCSTVTVAALSCGCRSYVSSALHVHC